MRKRKRGRQKSENEREVLKRRKKYGIYQGIYRVAPSPLWHYEPAISLKNYKLTNFFEVLKGEGVYTTNIFID